MYYSHRGAAPGCLLRGGGAKFLATAARAQFIVPFVFSSFLVSCKAPDCRLEGKINMRLEFLLVVV